MSSLSARRRPPSGRASGSPERPRRAGGAARRPRRARRRRRDRASRRGQAGQPGQSAGRASSAAASAAQRGDAAETARPPRRPSRSAAPRRSTRSRSASRSSRPTCTPSCSSSSARTSTTPTWTRPSSRAASARCSADVLARQDRPISNATGPDHPGDQRRHPRLRPDRAVPARPGRLRGHGQRPEPDLPRARAASSTPVDAQFTDEATCAAHRQDRVPDRPPRRRVQPDGGRPPARRQPCQRRHPAAGHRRLVR